MVLLPGRQRCNYHPMRTLPVVERSPDLSRWAFIQLVPTGGVDRLSEAGAVAVLFGDGR
jgi:hypothetical protein